MLQFCGYILLLIFRKKIKCEEGGAVSELYRKKESELKIYVK